MRALISILRRTGIIWTLVLLTSLPALAALEDEVAGDFEPLDGYVVMKEGGEFIIDLDASHGLQPGDIFAVAGPGKEIIHPVTKKVLGKLENIKGVLKVTRIKSGYSFARALDGAEEIRRADPIRHGQRCRDLRCRPFGLAALRSDQSRPPDGAERCL